MSEADRQAGEQQALDAVLMTEGERQHLQGGFPVSAFADGAEWGAGWAFAIVGMAQAIREGRFCATCDKPLGYVPGWGRDICGACARQY